MHVIKLCAALAELFSLSVVDSFVFSSLPLSTRSITKLSFSTAAHEDKRLRSLCRAGMEVEESIELASYAVVGNLQSGTNIGRIIRTATIFGVEELVVVGQRKFNAFGNHGTQFDLKTKHFFRPIDAWAYLKEEKNAKILGIEIEAGAMPLMSFDRNTGQASFPFQGPTAFVFGNEGDGMSPGFRAICDDFVYIPQVRGGREEIGDGKNNGGASLNVACAAAVVLQAYAVWAGFPEAPRIGEKFAGSVLEFERPVHPSSKPGDA